MRRGSSEEWIYTRRMEKQRLVRKHKELLREWENDAMMRTRMQGNTKDMLEVSDLQGLWNGEMVVMEGGCEGRLTDHRV